QKSEDAYGKDWIQIIKKVDGELLNYNATAFKPHQTILKIYQEFYNFPEIDRTEIITEKPYALNLFHLPEETLAKLLNACREFKINALESGIEIAPHGIVALGAMDAEQADIYLETERRVIEKFSNSGKQFLALGGRVINVSKVPLGDEKDLDFIFEVSEDEVINLDEMITSTIPQGFKQYRIEIDLPSVAEMPVKKENLESKLVNIEYVPYNSRENKKTVKKILDLLGIICKKQSNSKHTFRPEYLTAISRRLSIQADYIAGRSHQELLSYKYPLVCNVAEKIKGNLGILSDSVLFEAEIFPSFLEDYGEFGKFMKKICMNLEHYFKDQREKSLEGGEREVLEKIADTVGEWKGSLQAPAVFDSLKTEFNRCFIDDIFNEIPGVCIFNNNVHSKASLLFHADENSYLLSLNGYAGGKMAGTIGSAILFDAENEKGEEFLVVEGVVADDSIIKNRIREAKKNPYFAYEMIFDAILAYTGFKSKKLFINASHSSSQIAPHEFKEFVARKLEGKGIEIKRAFSKNPFSFELLEPENPFYKNKEGIWFSHFLRKIPIPQEIINQIFTKDEKGIPVYDGKMYSDTWYLNAKSSGEKEPCWNSCEGYVRGFEIDLSLFS
ncbi:hypothetical protein KY308_02975, partial [Candidatus Woesearchaeota archaeon]|nr:hypothetical protein [Candidatus Woesearchaeota archaeon]